ncbi:MAG: DNA topoisomerase I [Candidatus Diapherotrites archaeon]|nr:DNA topoisomerase I [Candidatus Diapherotrites archaeon]
MKIIIAEKNIAGKRIAEILAGKSVPAEIDAGAQFYEFTKDGQDFMVIPLRGHIADVDFPAQYSQWMGTDLKKLTDAEIEYVGTEKAIIWLLKKKAKGAEEAIIATDSDREGEAIGVEALNYLKEGNPKIKAKRAYFSAITPKDIQTAFAKLNEVDYNFADSANARREIDLIWGAVLTRYLSIVSGRLGKEFISMGRVQGPVLKLIVDREKERLAFEQKKYWVVSAIFEKLKEQFSAIHKEGKFWEKGKAEEVMKHKSEKGTVVRTKTQMKILKRPLPFNTTLFLRAASGIGMTAGDAMNSAESLYMKGYTSYPRTDNTAYPTNLDLKEILNNFLPTKEFGSHVEKILARGKLEPSAGKETKDHPPIHPVTYVSRTAVSDREWKVYELIVRRFLATLGEDAQTDNTTVEIDMNKEIFVATGQIILKAGWKEVYPYSQLNEVILPELKEKDIVDLVDLKMEEKETQPPARFSQGTLIKIMEELGIGTKATRHEILNKLYSRKYISGLKSIEPNKIAFAVIDSLGKRNSEVITPEMTSGIEKQMDEISSAKTTKNNVVLESRKILMKELEKLLAEKTNIGMEIRHAIREDGNLMQCWVCKEGSLRILTGKTGKRFLGCTNYPKCSNSFPLPQNGKIDNTKKECQFCHRPIIKVLNGRRSYEMCLNYQCESKKEWKSFKTDKTEPAKTGEAKQEQKPQTTIEKITETKPATETKKESGKIIPKTVLKKETKTKTAKLKSESKTTAKKKDVKK